MICIATYQTDPMYEVLSRREGATLNPFTTGNPFLGTKLLGFSRGRGSGALKGLTPSDPPNLSLI